MTIFFLFIKIACEVLTFAIVLRAILSWFPIKPYNPVIIVLNQITEPTLAPIRRLIPRAGMLDLSPLIAILALQLIYTFVP
ncbi:MAG TPA: YggT family protein [Dehalococcoidia bacterium]|nr:YggT family protein [Dehalococcoidia bacterium]